ncbi:hypothetical protein QOT17_008677 [Balamuthia mandrillaris]
MHGSFDACPVLQTRLQLCSPFLQGFFRQLENNLQIVNLNPNLWNMALAKYTQGSKTASSWVQNNIVIPRLPWHQARDVYATHFGSAELQTPLHDELTPSSLQQQRKNTSTQHPVNAITPSSPTSTTWR